MLDVIYTRTICSFPYDFGLSIDHKNFSFILDKINEWRREKAEKVEKAEKAESANVRRRRAKLPRLLLLLFN